MAYPSNTEIEEAKDFLKTRISAEQSMSYNLEEALYIAALKILEICRKYSTDPKLLQFSKNSRMWKEIQKVLDELKDDLYNICEELCVYANEDDKDHIIAFIGMAIYGMSLISRISKHVDTFANNIKAYILASATTPLSITRTAVIGTAAFALLNRLLRHTIERAYMDEYLEQHKDAIGFWSFRGSSYPCSTCDDYVGYHPIEEYALPLHPNCCCYAVFTY